MSWGLTERQALALLGPGGWAGGGGKAGEEAWTSPVTQGCVQESWAGQEGAELWHWMLVVESGSLTNFHLFLPLVSTLPAQSTPKPTQTLLS